MVKNSIYIPSRGDCVWLSFSPQAGHEQSGIRPALVVSPREYNEIVGLGLFCPITKREKGYPFEVDLGTTYPLQGVILADHIKSLDWKARKAMFICSVDKEIIEETMQKIGTLLTL